MRNTIPEGEIRVGVLGAFRGKSFAETAEALKKRGVTDFQLYYAINLLERFNPNYVPPAPVIAAATK